MQIKSNVRISSTINTNVQASSTIKSKVNDYLPIIGSYNGLANNQAEVLINNQNRTIEVKLKPHSYAQFLEFPNLGDSSTIYIDESKNKAYRWSDSELKYYCIGSDYQDIEIINGGTA